MAESIAKVLRFIKRLFNGKAKVWGKPTQHPITYAFTFDGVEYYHFENVFNLPYQRGFTAIAIYEEFNMRITRDVLEGYLDAFDKLVNSESIKLVELIKLNSNLRDRMDWVMEPDTVLKLASVVYFTKEENPANYDVVYNSKKIKSWKRDGSTMLDFFLQVPLKELCPFLTQPPEAIHSYLRGSLAANLYHLKGLLKVLSHGDCDEHKLANLRSKIAESEALISIL